jgi:ATP-dependent helicase/nuclease subunit A
MMGWTIAQQKVIDTRDKNLLVSAAAGSGKTAVLVERIISMICEGDKPVDIDHLLVVTFTNAAAAEMRERIGKAIDKRLQDDPDNLHLQRQISLLQSAQITTIHSFCLNVIRNYFHRIDLDPSFKIAEDSEITLMKSDVISDILERWYEAGTEEFHDFVESYSYSKSDLPIEELVLQLYGFAMSDPWPRVWILRMRKRFEIGSLTEMNQTSWMCELLDYVKIVLEDLGRKNARALEICNEADGPSAYEAALLSDRSILGALNKAESYEEYAGLFPGISYDRLSNKREEGVQPWKKDRVKELREEVKKGIKDLTNQYFFQTPEEMLADLQAVGRIMQVLFDLTLEFMDEFAGKKEEKNLIDFNDLEHFALKILVREEPLPDSEGGTIARPTDAAIELSEQFAEILIDEYQDSNMVQETILRSISREDMGRPNRFMVGDVKQSIYKFRLAMPEIFMEKYGSYSCEEQTREGEVNYYQRIDLDKNFRSRETVLKYVNQIFEQIMQRNVGGIVYDEAASLKYGELYEEVLSPEDMPSEEICSRIARDTELLLITEEEADALSDTGEDKEESDEEEAVYTKRELEARAIVRRIKELIHPETGMMVFDQKSRLHRLARLKDIVILLRSMAGWSDVFVNTLMQEGIPAYADTGTGYFQTLEITSILNMLKIIDNPRQDIPLAGVLYSSMVGLTTTELAFIRASHRNVSLYSALLQYAEEELGQGAEEMSGQTAGEVPVQAAGNVSGRFIKELPDQDTKEASSQGAEEVPGNSLKVKVADFLKQLEDFRSLVNHTPIHELIQLVLDKTGYYYYASAMPGGEQRQANMDMLIAQAVRFEKGSYSGLFHFIRYIEKLHKYEVDFGEAATTGEQDNTVRIMSIHKSKGLEFPIVIAAGMSKQFNTQDIRSSIVLHSELGVGPDYIDSKLRTKVPTLLKKVIQKKVQIENLGEELRVLYVAMTRAREKLILTGYLKSRVGIKNKEFSFFEKLSAKSYLDWVLPAMVNCMGSAPEGEEGSFLWKQNSMVITVLTRNEILREEITKQIFRNKDIRELEELHQDITYNSELREEIKTRFNYEYPHQKEAALKVKMTVSELKKLGQFQDEEQSLNLYPGNRERLRDEEGTVPAFLRGDETVISGTDRGSIYHKVLELINLSEFSEEKLPREELHQRLQQQLDQMVRKNRLKAEDIKKLNLNYIKDFLSGDVAKRMRRAQLGNRLYKEKQFVMGLKASEVLKETDSEELILIQGIIDAFFEEEGELVLVDYKSDLVSEEEQLVHRYQVQLLYYKRALEQMLGKKVKEMIIYSLPLGKEIRIDE